MSILFALALQSAARQSPLPPTSQADLDAISDACHAPRKWLELRGDEIVFRGNPDAKYAKLECVLKTISAITAKPNLGPVGNLRAAEEK